MKEKIVPVIAVIAIVLSIVSLALNPRVKAAFGTASGLLIENYIPAILYNDGYKSEKEIVLSGANGDITTGDDLTVTDDETINGGVLTVTTANTATSTAVVGCVQTYATSTATAVRFGIGTIATSSPLSSGGTGLGFVLWQYGSCPF